MAQQKNIILITVDDGGAFWRFRDVFGAQLQTPNLDRMFAASTVFSSAYCQAPICGPSRNSLMSGLAPHQTGILDNYINLFSVLRPEQLWQFKLKQAGYYCSTAGKIHHGFGPLPKDIHDTLYSHPPQRIKFGPPRDVPVTRFGGLTGGAATTDPEHDALYYDHQSASDAINFLQNHDANVPFYREVGFHHPHIPLKTPLAFKQMYDEEEFVQPEAWKNGFDVSDYPDQFMVENIDLRDQDYWRKSVRNYFSAYSHVDSHVGRVWDALQASAHADNTVVVFTSDHGFHLGDKNRMRKYTLWEETCRVPLMVHDPQVAPREIADPVALLDVGPTILDYAGCQPLRGAPGKSLRPLIDGDSDPDRAVPTFLFGNTSMRKGQYRITLYQNGDSEFHDVDKDPWLTSNLAGKHPDYDRMRRELVAVSANHGLTLSEADIRGPAPFFAVNSEHNARPTAGGRGAIAALDGARPDPTPTAPGYGVLFSTLTRDGDAVLPQGFARMYYGADTGGQLNVYSAYGNNKDNEFVFPGSFNRFTLTVHPGPGDNLIIAQNDDLVVYGGEGHTEIRAGNANCVLFGGTGSSTIHTGDGRCQLHGGGGDAQMFAGSGPAEMISGMGQNTLTTGAGATWITLDGGQNTVVIHSSEIHIAIRRTGLAQHVIGLQGGTIDLSDWAVMGPTQLHQAGADTVLTCATERVVFSDTKVGIVRQAITGTELT